MSNTVHSLDCRYILSLSRCFLRFVRLSWPTLHYQILHQALSVSNFLNIVDTPVTVFSSPLPRHTVIWTSCRTDTDFLSQVPKYGLNLLNMNHYSALVLVNIMIYCRYIPKESLLVDIHFIHIVITLSYGCSLTISQFSPVIIKIVFSFLITVTVQWLYLFLK